MTPAPATPRTVRVDCHLHTMWSGDATTTPEELRDAVARSGIDVLCITDHSTINGAVELRESLGCEVVVGQELRTGAGELMGLFLTRRIPPGLKPVEFCERVRDQGGLVYVPHPFDPARHCMNEGVLRELAASGHLDVVEVFNAKTSLASLNQRAADFATEFGLPGGAGSDAHVPEAVGSAYVEMPAFDTSSPASFLAALRSPSAVVVGTHCDPARAWRPRIVPSTRAL